jgi:hypothetical protein
MISALTSTATQHGGQEPTLFSIITNLLHFGMVVVGLDDGHVGQVTLDEMTGGSPCGATTIAGGDGVVTSLLRSGALPTDRPGRAVAPQPPWLGMSFATACKPTFSATTP